MKKIAISFIHTDKKNHIGTIAVREYNATVSYLEQNTPAGSFKNLCLQLGDKLKSQFHLDRNTLIYWGETCQEFVDINEFDGVNVQAIYEATTVCSSLKRIKKVLGTSLHNFENEINRELNDVNVLLKEALILSPEYQFMVDPTRLVDTDFQEKYEHVFEALRNSYLDTEELLDFIYSVPEDLDDEWNTDRLDELITETDVSNISSYSSLAEAIELYKETGELYTIQLTKDKEAHEESTLIDLMWERTTLEKSKESSPKFQSPHERSVLLVKA